MAATGGEKSVIVVAIDDSEHGFYALEWTIDHLILQASSPFKLFIVHAKPSASSTIGLAGPGAADVLPYVDADLKRIASRVLEKAKEICTAKSVGIRHMECGLALLTLSSGPDHPDVAETLINIGIMYQDLGNRRQALLFFEKASDLTNGHLEEKCYETAVFYHALAVSFNARKTYKLVVQNEEETKAILVKLL